MPAGGSLNHKLTEEDRLKGLQKSNVTRRNITKKANRLFEYLYKNCIDELDERIVMDAKTKGHLCQALEVMEDHVDFINEQDKAEGKIKVSKKDTTNWTKIAWMAICTNTSLTFLKQIQCFLDPRYRIASYKFGLGAFTSEENRESRAIFDEWFLEYRARLEVNLAMMYHRSKFATQDLEILKRRYKNNWSEKIESSVDSTIESKSEVTINFVTT
jgi:hypothetical protein